MTIMELIKELDKKGVVVNGFSTIHNKAEYEIDISKCNPETYWYMDTNWEMTKLDTFINTDIDTKWEMTKLNKFINTDIDALIDDRKKLDEYDSLALENKSLKKQLEEYRDIFISYHEELSTLRKSKDSLKQTLNDIVSIATNTLEGED